MKKIIVLLLCSACSAVPIMLGEHWHLSKEVQICLVIAILMIEVFIGKIVLVYGWPIIYAVRMLRAKEFEAQLYSDTLLAREIQYAQAQLNSDMVKFSDKIGFWADRYRMCQEMKKRKRAVR